MDIIEDDTRPMNYYFAEESLPRGIRDDAVWPHYGEYTLNRHFKGFWHGIGTITEAHYDSNENFMCVFKGYKNFTIVSPFQSEYLYKG